MPYVPVINAAPMGIDSRRMDLIRGAVGEENVG